MKGLADLDVRGRRVLMRVDFSVPVERGEVADDTRIRETLPTIRDVVSRGGRLILVSHLGRPKAKREPEFSMAPAARCLQQHLRAPVKLLDDCVGPQIEAATKAMKDGEIVMLENVRFHGGEEKNDADFARKLAALGDVYVNDAFAVSHRAHASVDAAARLFKERAAGQLLAKEIQHLGRLLEDPQHPFTAILGGAKVDDKIKLIENILPRVDAILVGGGMAYTFLAARGVKIGASKLAPEMFDTCKRILADAEKRRVKLILPEDSVVADRIESSAATRVISGDIPDGLMGLDIGPGAVEAFKQVLTHSKTVFWNGPLGVFEKEAFARGTGAIAHFVAGLGAVKIAGGGDTAAALEHFRVAQNFTHVSTGGGASMMFLEGTPLPGIVALG